MISEKKFLEWQNVLSQNPFARRLWMFFGIYILWIFYIIGGMLLFYPDGRKTVALGLIALILARFVVCEGIYLFYKKSRPFHKLNFTPLSSPAFFSTVNLRARSFPSAHAASLSAISLMVFFYFPILGVFLFISTFLNSVGRIVLGYHDIYDILGGWVIGVLAALIIYNLFGPII